MKPQHKLVIIAVVIVGVAIGYMSVANGNVGSTKTTAEGVTKVFAKVDADAQATVPIALTEGSGVEHESAHVFEAIQSLPGVKQATILMDGTAIVVAYASSEIGEADIRSALAGAGYGSEIPE